jgi:chromate reductase
MTLVIAGTNRKNSRSRAVADIYAKTLEAAGDNSEVLDLNILPKDFIFSALYENALTHPEFNKLQDKIDNTEKIAFIISEYNGSIPGALKAFIDGLRYPDTFTYKKGALVGFSSNTQGAALALSHMSDILSHLGMHVLPQRVKIPFVEQNLDKSQLVLTDQFYKDLLSEQVNWFTKF